MRVPGEGLSSLSELVRIKDYDNLRLEAELCGLKDLFELSCTGDQVGFLEAFLPWALDKLQKTKISFEAEATEHKLRAGILGILRVAPAFPDITRPHVEALASTMFHILQNDADHNAAEAMQIFMDMNKAFRATLEHHVAPFLDFILELAENFKEMTSERLAEGKRKSILAPARRSFRLLHDAPVMIVLVFQLHRRFINEYIPKFVPVIIKVLQVDAVRPPYKLPDIESIDQLASQPVCHPRGAFNDYISAQIKVLSFLAYIARGFAPTLREYKDLIPSIVVRLLARCPPECAPSRKELLVAVRHILSTELRSAFLPHLEVLMDEGLLLGEGYTAFYIFRPAAFSMLADLIHHVRMELHPGTIEKVIRMYSRALHDPTLPNGIQTMSIKLLLNLVDTIMTEKFPADKRRPCLLYIFTSLLHKFDWLQKIVAEILSKRRSDGIGAGSKFDEKRFDPFFDDPLNARPIPTDSVALDPSRDNFRDLKFQFKTLISGAKSLIIALRSCPSSPAASEEATKKGSSVSPAGHLSVLNGFTSLECEAYMVKLFHDGILCFDLFHLKALLETADINGGSEAQSQVPVQAQLQSQVQHSQTSPGSIPSDEKDLLDQFGYLFTLLDPQIFQDVIASNMDFLIERTKDNLALVSIPQYFLAISGISRNFAAILARHLMERFEEVGSANPIAGAVVLRLFKLLFLAVSVYPEENEIVLQPHLSEIILSCFRHYSKASNPLNYFLLLRSLFRSIGGGRFDGLYKEVLPLLQTILDELTHISPGAADPSLREMYVELCLTTPVRLSNLLPYLSYLMKPVLLALQSGTDLVNQGLRTFELCIDNLTPDFLEPIISPVFNDILSCLWKMLKPPPANQLHSHTAVRLLGKLGGKSRRFLTSIPSYSYRKSIGAGSLLSFKFELAMPKSILVSGDHIARIAMLTLNSPGRSVQVRREALVYLKRCIAGMFSCYDIPREIEKAADHLISLRPESADPEGGKRDRAEFDGRSMARGDGITKLINDYHADQSWSASVPSATEEASQQLFCEIVCALFDASHQPEFREEIAWLVTHIYRSAALLHLYATVLKRQSLGCLDFDLLADIMLEYSTAQNDLHVQLAWDVLRGNYEQACLFISDKDLQCELKVFFLTTDKAICACFRANYWQRIAACRTIAKICDLDLSLKFFWSHEIRLIRGVLYVMKSLPPGASSKFSEELTSIIFKVLRLANRLDRDDSLARADDAVAMQRKHYFDQVMLALVTELSNPNVVVRDAVKASFQLLSDIQGCEVTDLLLPLKTRVYGPIFSKPLRALPIHVQVGYIDAITYCLALRPPLLELHEELLRLINEAIVVIESEDSALVSRLNQSHHSRNLLNLRLVCIKLLSTCLSAAEFQNASLHPIRNQIVSVFFKMLYARQSELVDASRTALEQVMAQHHKLPTELLQNGLRPVLQSLGEPKHLNLAAVEGLRRILQLFSHFFKAEIGRKLLDHLHAWAEQQCGTEPQTSSVLSPGKAHLVISTENSMEVKVMTAIMELFCLLPNCGQMFMSELVQVVLRLESALRKMASSPFRPVLLRFMELYPTEAISYLMKHIGEEEVVHLYMSLLCRGDAHRATLEVGKVLNDLFEHYSSPTTSPDLRVCFITIIKHYFIRSSADIPESTGPQRSGIIAALWNYLIEESKRKTLDHVDNILAKITCEITVEFLNSNQGQVECAFMLLRSFMLFQVFDTTDLPSFYRSWLQKCSVTQLHDIISQWLTLYRDPAIEFMIKERAARLLVQPFVAELHRLDEQDLNSVITDSVLSTFDHVIWGRDCRACHGGSCVLAVEEVQITVLLLDLMKTRWPVRMYHYLPRIQSFLFNRVQSLDCSVKYSALFTLGLCLIETKSDPKDVLTIFKLLLSAPTADIRAVLKQSFDLLLPFLVQQDQAIVSHLIDDLRGCFMNDSPLMSLILALWHCFNTKRAVLRRLAPSLLSALAFSFSKCSVLAFASPENRPITFDLARTLLLWHKEAESDGPGGGSGSPLSKKNSLIELILNGLLRCLSTINDLLEPDLFAQGLEILESYLSEFSQKSFNFKLSILDRMFVNFENTDDQNISTINSGLQILTLIISHRSSSLSNKDLMQYEKTFKSILEKSHGKIMLQVNRLVSAALQKIDSEESPASSDDLRDFLMGFVIDGLNNGRNLSVCFSALAADTNCVFPPETVLTPFTRAFQRSVFDYLGRQDSVPNASSLETSGSPHFMISHILLPAINYGVRLLDHAEMPRATFLCSLHHLWEHNTNVDLHLLLLNQIQLWIKSSQPVPSLREKVEFLLVPFKTELLSAQKLSSLYLNIVLDVYSRAEFAKTELRSRLEGAFLRGLRSESLGTRRQFFDIVNKSLPKSLASRIKYVFETQRWDLLGSQYWISTAAEILLEASVNEDSCVLVSSSLGLSEETSIGGMRSSEILRSFFQQLDEIARVPSSEHIRTISILASNDDLMCHAFWVELFSSIWSILDSDCREYLNGRLIAILSSDAYLSQARLRPNVMKSIIESMLMCDPPPSIPPLLVAYAMKTYAAWYSGCMYLEKSFELLQPDIASRDFNSSNSGWLELVSALGKVYNFLGEDDYMYGCYRTGFLLAESNIALSFNQMQIWGAAQKFYESSMSRCRAGTTPFCEFEFSVWEERWIACAQQLQQWDLLNEISKTDLDYETGLECLWRLADWGNAETHAAAFHLLKMAPEPTSRSKFFESFLFLNQNRDFNDRQSLFHSTIEEATQLALIEWQSLPSQPCAAHAKVLHEFQMIVELQESLALYSNLASGAGSVAALSRPQFLSDLKGLLTAWRERLPNSWDGMNYWSDILAWRQHVFTAINAAFAPLINEQGSGGPSQASNASATTASHPFAYRGYHEIAWLINRFAHIARKNHLFDICLSFLNRIYTLPNIEIQDAFLKLREQAKCHMESPGDLPHALEVVNATNLNYFSSLQKGEFFALRSVILSRLGLFEEANRVFAQAVQIDLNMGHGWAAWGRFNDSRFAQQHDVNLAVNAINCYLQAATLFKAHKSRRFLSRILWLLTFEDSSGSLGKSFEMYNHDLPTWYWVCFVPQLLSSLARREQRLSRFVLIKIAKNYPQALYLPLRTFYEDCRIQFGNFRGSLSSDLTKQAAAAGSAVSNVDSNSTGTTQGGGDPASLQDPSNSKKHPLESAEDLMSILKTAYPLLALTMENAMEHIVHRLRSNVEEDFLRVLTSLITEAYQHIMNRISGYGIVSANQAKLHMEASLKRVFSMICNSTSLGPVYKEEFEADFMRVSHEPNDVLEKLFCWRKKLEPALDKQPLKLSLDGLSRFLAEFEYHRYDDIDVPGQYLLMRDGNQDFVKIDKFDSMVGVIRRHGTSYRRLVIRGTDGQLHPFAVQNPAGRQTRREERILQLFRFLDVAIKRAIDCRRRNLYFNIPAVIPISSHVRIVSDDPAQTTYEEILERHFKRRGLCSEEVFLFYKEAVLSSMAYISDETPRNNVELLNLRTDLFMNICAKAVPDSVLKTYMDSMTLFSADRWVYRRDFTRQLGAMLLQHYIFSIGQRFLHKIGFSRKSTSAIHTEVLPMVTASGQISLIEIVPFRFTPNFQEYVSPIGTEGVLISALVSGARCLSKADSDMSEYLPIFVRDEFLLWYLNYCSSQTNQSSAGESQSEGLNTGGKLVPPVGEIVENPFDKLLASGVDEKTFFARVQQNCELILKRSQALACVKEQEQSQENSTSLFQTVHDLLSSASNPQKLAQMDGHWHPWF